MPLFSRAGAPFFPLGGQAHNSSAYNAAEVASAVAGVRALGGNTLEAPVYWEQVEPREGRFDFSAVDALFASCREAGLALVLLWFATWKNGEMRYTPEWVKQDRRRFRRVLGFDGTELEVLSSYCAATREADAGAFTALMRHVAAIDPGRDTLVAVQVENEPGILGSDRDYCDEASRAAAEPVPPELTDYLERTKNGPVHEEWRDRGGRRGESWLETFGLRAHEYREAWSIARFIDDVARAGRRAMDVPMYVNAWLSQDSLPVPGTYPSGGPIWRTLEIWKAAAPSLAVIAPDIYVRNQASYREVCAQYRRADNPLFVPESGADDSNAMNMLRAIAEFDAEGYACFGVDGVLDLQGALRPQAALFAQSFAAVTAMAPLLTRYRGTGKIHAVVTEEHKGSQHIELERFFGMVPLAAGARGSSTRTTATLGAASPGATTPSLACSWKPGPSSSTWPGTSTSA